MEVDLRLVCRRIGFNITLNALISGAHKELKAFCIIFACSARHSMYCSLAAIKR